jgi:hypothetical protein
MQSCCSHSRATQGGAPALQSGLLPGCHQGGGVGESVGEHVVAQHIGEQAAVGGGQQLGHAHAQGGQQRVEGLLAAVVVGPVLRARVVCRFQ